MEITTLIQWNSLVYVLYYALNLAYDYLRNPNRRQEKSVHYSYRDMLKETPVVVAVPETASTKSSIAQALQVEAQTKPADHSAPVTLDGPVEDQGIPFEEIMQNAKSYTHEMNF